MASRAFIASIDAAFLGNAGSSEVGGCAVHFSRLTGVLMSPFTAPAREDSCACRWFEGGVSCRGGRLLNAIHTILVPVGIRRLCHDVQIADLPRRVPFIAQTLILGVAHAATRARARGIFFRAPGHHVTPVRLVTDYDRVTAGAGRAKARYSSITSGADRALLRLQIA